MNRETATIRLGDLEFGHARKDSINSRRSDREAEVEALADNIAAEGLLYPLVVTKRAGKKLVAAGNRRLAALRLLAERGHMSEDDEISCIVVEYDEAKKLSLVENFHRQQLHPVDQYRAFAELGLEANEVAERFGMPVRTARQVMALGSIHPTILDAFREGNIEADAVRQFTLTSDQKAQLEAFKALRKAGMLHRYAIRRKLVAEDTTTTTDPSFALVSLDEYIEAGGRVHEDLFSDDPIILDRSILHGLRTAKEQQLIAIIAQAGAAKTMDRFEADDGWYLRQQPAPDLPDHEPPAGFADFERIAEGIRDALAGIADLPHLHVLVDVRTYGFSISLVTPPDAAADDAPDPDDTALNDPPARPAEPETSEPEPGETISAALSATMHDALSVAMARVIARHPTLAMHLMLAALHTRYGSPLRIRLDGHQAIDVEGKPEIPGGLFTESYAQFAGLDAQDTAKELAICAAASIDVSDGAQHRENVRRSYIQHLIDVLPHDELVAELRELMPMQEYLQGCTKARLLAVMREALAMGSGTRIESIGWSGRGEPEHIETLIKNNGYASAKKDALVNVVFVIVEATGWLPPQYRQSAEKEG